MKRTTIALTDDLAELVRREARRRDASASEVIRDAIRQALAETSKRRRRIPWAGLFDDPGMVRAERQDEQLEQDWAEDIDRDRG